MWSPIIQPWVLVPKGLAGNRLCYFLLSCGNVMWGLWWLIVLPWLHMQQACNGYRPLICWAGWNRALFTPWLHHLQRWLLVRRIPVCIWEQPWGSLNKDWVHFYKIWKRKAKKNKRKTHILSYFHITLIIKNKITPEWSLTKCKCFPRKNVRKSVRNLSENMSERCQKECHKICQKECEKICQKECQKICQKECQKICEKECQKYVRRYVRKNVRKTVRNYVRKYVRIETARGALEASRHGSSHGHWELWGVSLAKCHCRICI